MINQKYVLYQKTYGQFFPTRIDGYDTIEEAQDKALELARVDMLAELRKYRNPLSPIDTDGELRYSTGIGIFWGSDGGIYFGSITTVGTMTSMNTYTFAIRKE